MDLSNSTKVVAGVLLVTVPSIEFGGSFLLRMLKTAERGYMDNPLRQNMFRAGHAHAGVIVILSLVIQLYVDALALPGSVETVARLGAPVAAILMPLGFFLCVTSPDATKPNGLIKLVYIGAVCLAVSVLTVGIALVGAGV